MHILTDFDEQDRHSCILAGGNGLGLGIGSVFEQEFYDLLACRRMFPAARRAHGVKIVVGQAVRGAAQEFTDRLSHFTDIYCSQCS